MSPVHIKPAGHWPLALLLTCTPLVCGAGKPPPQEYLDPETAATVTIVGEPLVFARSRIDLAANSRDYVTAAAAAVDRSGRISYVLVVYFWSTVDPRIHTDPLPDLEPLVLQVDDRRIEFSSRERSPHDAGIGVPVHPPPGRAVTPVVYHTDLGTLRSLAECRRLTLVAETPVTTITYELWEDQRAALRAFVRQMSGGP
ncbi:MAG: hypothetical protein JSR67_04340 [Proteobacteria bacterium]|nr:hypothetical protein [Pseudomonadota bacterium]